MESKNISLYNIFCENGYFPVDKENINIKEKIKCFDGDGYIVYPSWRNIREKKKPLRFHANNPDTIENIKHYININNIDVNIISDKYIDAHSNLTFQCSCKRFFEASWTNFSFKQKYQCNECSIGKPTHAVSYNDVINLVQQAGLTPLFSEDDYLNIGSRNVSVENENGYRSILTYQFIEQGTSPIWFHKSNPYTIYNINLFLKYDTDSEYECVSDEYLGKNSDLTILHKKCGNTFNTTWGNLYRRKSESEPNRHGTRCPYCTGLRSQSLHAIVLKQLFLKLKKGTIVEDKSCRNPLTNCILPTDIVNHPEKIVIEIQSWFHDSEEQKVKDKIKKDFWESKGYKVYTPDIRDYSVLEMVQLFFPEITEIPKWVKYDFEQKLNVDMAQDLLNSGLLVTEVALNMGVSTHRIYDNIYHKKLVYPNNYPNRDLIKSKHIINQQVTVQTAG